MRVRCLGRRDVEERNVRSIFAFDQQHGVIFGCGLADCVSAGRHLCVTRVNGNEVVKSTPFAICATAGIQNDRNVNPVMTANLPKFFMMFDPPYMRILLGDKRASTVGCDRS
jgi:hypothetical protein